MKIRRLIFLIVMLAAAGGVFAEDTPLLIYQWDGGYSPYKQVRVAVFPSGRATVEGEKHGFPPVDYTAQLSPEGVAYLRSLVRSTDFFNQTGKEAMPVPSDTGQSTLTVHAGGDSKTIRYRANPSLEPLVAPLWKLVAQAFAIKALESDRDIHSAANVVRENSSGKKALQPHALKEPLKSYIVNHDERENVKWALEALAWIMRPEDYAGFISMGIDDASQRNLLLDFVGTHAFYGNIPKSHFDALCPVYLPFVRDVRSRLSEADSLEKEALSEFTSAMGKARCKSAIPLFKDWFEDHDKPYVDGSFIPLAMMGDASLEALLPYLDSPKEAHRLNAAELLGMASQYRPGRYAHFMSRYEYSSMIPMFTKTVIPRLSELYEDDSSAKVRKKAGEAIEVINKEVEAHRKEPDN